MGVSRSRKPTTVNFDLGLSGLVPLLHTQNCFSPTLKCSVKAGFDDSQKGYKQLPTVSILRNVIFKT